MKKATVIGRQNFGQNANMKLDNADNFRPSSMMGQTDSYQGKHLIIIAHLKLDEFSRKRIDHSQQRSLDCKGRIRFGMWNRRGRRCYDHKASQVQLMKKDTTFSNQLQDTVESYCKSMFNLVRNFWGYKAQITGGKLLRGELCWGRTAVGAHYQRRIVGDEFLRIIHSYSNCESNISSSRTVLAAI
uniref:Uncharacterized protein n=1 Tax=Romanomermis culicivorax TaxID=13658 RepID=A0A915HJW4_ROMCU